MKSIARTSFTVPERVLAALGLALAAIGLVNQALWQRSLLGLDSKQLAIVAFMPLFLIIYYVLQRPDPRGAE